MTKQMNDTELLGRTIVPFLIWDKSIPTDINSMPCIGKSGTCFFVQHKNIFYCVTAHHCLSVAKPKDIFIALPNKEMKGLPVSHVLVSYYDEPLKTDTDVILVRMPILDTLVAKTKADSNKLAFDILNTPHMKRQIRLNKHRSKKEALDKIMGSSFYKNITQSKEQSILNIIDKAYTDDLKIRVLKLREFHDMKAGDACVALGIPKSDFSINYENRTINSLILAIKCEFLGLDSNRHDYVFKCKDVEKLNGMSGGPILFDNTVIAVLNSANIAEGKIYATPLTTQFFNEASKIL